MCLSSKTVIVSINLMGNKEILPRKQHSQVAISTNNLVFRGKDTRKSCGGERQERTQITKTKLVLCVGSLVKIVTQTMFFQKRKLCERKTQRIFNSLFFSCSISLLLSYLKNLDRKLWFGLTLGGSFLSSKEACLLLSCPIFLLGKWHLGTVPHLLFNFFLRLLLIHWILSYCSMSFLTHLIHHVWNYVVLYVLREFVSCKHLHPLQSGNAWSATFCPMVYLSTEFLTL